MRAIQFDRDAMAKWYAKQHWAADPGLRKIYYLPNNAPPREIRLVEVNALIAAMSNDALEPIDFGVDTGSKDEHKLLVLDVTPSQWELIAKDRLPLPTGWSLEHAMQLAKPGR
jgi:hypothetical protein